MNRSDVIPAVRHGVVNAMGDLARANVRCIPWFALNAVKIPRCRSSPAATVQFTAGIASVSNAMADQEAGKKQKRDEGHVTSPPL